MGRRLVCPPVFVIYYPIINLTFWQSYYYHYEVKAGVVVNNFNSMNVVWIVSFQVDDAGRFLNYEVDQFDLQDHPGSADKLSSLLGKGVFTSAEEARIWAEKQFSVGTGGCGRGCNGGCGGGGCCHK